MADFQFPNFGVSGFPYQNYVQQLLASLGPMGGTIPSGAPQGSQWNPIQQVPAPPLTPGMTMPAVPPGSGTPYNPNNPVVPPAGYSGAGGGGAAIPKSAMATAQPGFGGAEYTNVSPADANRFAFTIPEGYSTNGGLANLAFSPNQSDSTQGNRQMTIMDAQGNILGSPGAAGQNGIQYFSVGGAPVDRWGNPMQGYANLQPGQTYYASFSGANPNSTPGASALDIALRLGNQTNMRDFLRTVEMNSAGHLGERLREQRGYNGSMPSPNGAITKPVGDNKMAGGGLLNVTQGAPGIQATTGLTGANGQQFGFTVPQGANGMGQFSFSPTGDQTAVNRQVTFTDANGNPIPGLSSAGIESGQYFNIGPGGDPNLPMLMPGQQYFANLSGGVGPYGSGPANVDYGINFNAGRMPSTQDKLAMARNDFLARHGGVNGGMLLPNRG